MTDIMLPPSPRPAPFRALRAIITIVEVLGWAALVVPPVGGVGYAVFAKGGAEVYGTAAGLLLYGAAACLVVQAVAQSGRVALAVEDHLWHIRYAASRKSAQEKVGVWSAA
jgi:hypothetical protein